MLSKYLTLLLAVVALLYLLSSASAYASYEVFPSININNFIIYYEEVGAVTNISLANVFPPTFRIQYVGEYDAVVNAWWCPAWWDPNCDPANYRYRVISKEYEYVALPPQVIEYNGTRILLTYFTSISVLPHASRSWWGWFEERVKISLSVHIYGRIDKPPSKPVKIDLGKLIAENITSERVVINYLVRVERVKPSHEKYLVNDSFELVLEGLELFFYELYAESISPYVHSAEEVGSFEEIGYIMIVPKGSIYVTLCLNGEGEYRLEGTLSYRTEYGTSEANVVLDSGSCVSAELSNVVLIPGNYTGNNKFVVTFKSGSFVLNLKSDVEIYGVMGAVSIPYALLTQNGSVWWGKIYAGVDYSSYMTYEPIYVIIKGVISVEGITKNFTCSTAEFTSKGIYECIVNIGEIGLSPLEVTDASAYLTVTLSTYRSTVEDSITVNCTVIAPTSTRGTVAIMYKIITYTTLALVLATVFLYLINHLVGVVVGKYLIEPYHIIQSLITATALASVVFATPYIHWFMLKLLNSVPEFQQFLTKTPLGTPNVLNAPPDEAIAMLMSYYDITLTSLKLDYKVWFEEQMGAHVFPRLVALSAIIAFLVALSFALMITMNAPVAGTALLPIIGFLASVIGMLVMLTPLAGVVLALTAVAEVFLAFSAIMFLTIYLAGIVLSVVPTHITTRVAGDFVGAGILYVLAVPALGPLIYCIYMYVLTTLEQYVSVVEEHLTINLIILTFSVDFIIPVAPIMRMVSFITVATLVTTMIILLQAYILSRTGLARGLGESLIRITRR